LSTDVSEVRTASIIRDNSEHHTRRRENLKSHYKVCLIQGNYHAMKTKSTYRNKSSTFHEPESDSSIPVYQ
jgi:hypothetical protein